MCISSLYCHTLQHNDHASLYENLSVHPVEDDVTAAHHRRPSVRDRAAALHSWHVPGECDHHDARGDVCGRNVAPPDHGPHPRAAQPPVDGVQDAENPAVEELRSVRGHGECRKLGQGEWKRNGNSNWIKNIFKNSYFINIHTYD